MNEYQKFVDKFKIKQTTDDCYTPPEVYEAVKGWVVSEYNITNEIIRPFKPNGDYESEDYTNKVVIDNPPFSILSSIINFCLERNISFFLFAPHLTCFNANESCGFIITDSQLIYHNGANIKTAFVTNLESDIRTSPTLAKLINEAQDLHKKPSKPVYDYPDNLITSTMLGNLVRRGIEFKIPKEKRLFVRKLDSQKELKKSIFGAGFLISDDLAKEKVKYYDVSKEYTHKFELSERERKLIDDL